MSLAPIFSEWRSNCGEWPPFGGSHHPSANRRNAPSAPGLRRFSGRQSGQAKVAGRPPGVFPCTAAAVNVLQTHILQTHGDINVLENPSRRDADYALRRFHQIVTLAPRVLTAQAVDERKIASKPPGFDQKARAVSLPLSRFHVALPQGLSLCRHPRPSVERLPLHSTSPGTFFSRLSAPAPALLGSSDRKCTGETAAGQFSIFGAVEEKNLLRIRADICPSSER
jgi:hypothetical protein